MSLINQLVFKRFMAIRPAVNVPKLKGNKPKFERNMPINRRVKAWERAGEDKDDFFRRKYAHVHARQKEGRRSYEKHSAKEETQPPRQSFFDRPRRNANPSRYLQANPLLEYVYGTNSVLAALQSNKREYFTKLYYHGSLQPDIENLSKSRSVELVKTDKHNLNLLTKDAVHNNVVLETKPLKPIEINNLETVNTEDCTFQITEQSLIKKTKSIGYISNENKKFPLGVYLDEVMDPHNVGAIIRSAYFLGADFVVMSRKNCAPLSGTVNKTSSGSMELLPIYYVDKPLTFFQKSSEEGGWSFISSCITDDIISKDNKFIKNKMLSLEDLSGLCKEFPVVLVVGNENTGIRTNLRMRSDFYVEIPFGRDSESDSNRQAISTVDSLNVSVATALLLNRILT
ncbi:hypothetical protein Kpol_1072p52 [Vanderwaltozyma polyspora DSM 70294]|uniref:rRNA methyltransferase 1, mitochondrial n=1 Tax=Vanderwaltozyma polyspora (strain ATCC 22028 / DSM 70294 / BCRC 21397 / CBS 2163 / NBRC 10782 / NRRL Y-8283 / UCD 57-17) TaxID=436907 RepID=A7TKS0_VANPO|nr:uncharacterized protein Kpol_1072p52 [Vanderwaltozyma polyspora DSM 70294]EDO17182.1 hypothetical protein Kpol_1072p52 [Vanderwaltozyma polyspora DSM 70294]